jgi:hypothetical protein
MAATTQTSRKKADAEHKSADPGSGVSRNGDLGIEHHMQDKEGFCGAACIMMLLANSSDSNYLISQSEIMRLIRKERVASKNEYPSSRMAWHASPEEITAVLSQLSPHEEWTTVQEPDVARVMARIGASLDAGLGAIALVWASKLGTSLPHWVVVTGKTIDRDAGGRVGYVILDPTAPGRPDTALRYEAIRHTRIAKVEAENGGKPEKTHGNGSDTCICQIWKDGNGREQTALRIWVPADRLEEMLDEGAVRGVGLRYAIVGTRGATEEIRPARFGTPEGADPTAGEHDLTVEERIRIRRLTECAKVLIDQAKLMGGMPVKVD